MIWTASTELFLFGDSITGNQANCITPWGPTMKLVAARFAAPNPPSPYAPFLPPRQSRPAVRGISPNPAQSCDLLAPDVATITANLRLFSGPSYTHAGVELGINDASRIQAATITVQQMSDAQNRILDAFLAVLGIAGTNVTWVGPWCTPAFLTTSTNSVEPTLRANVIARGGQYVSWLGVPITEPSGSDRTIGDNVHPNALGAAALAIPINAAVQIG